MRTFVVSSSNTRIKFMFEGLIYAFSGGYKTCKEVNEIIPVVYNSSSFAADYGRLGQLFLMYKRAKENLAGKQNSIFQQQLAGLTSWDKKKIIGLNNDDRIVIYCLLEKGNVDIKETIDIILNIKSCNPNVNINVVCEISNIFLKEDMVYWSTLPSLDVLNEITNVIYVGNKDCINNGFYNAICALCALMDSISNTISGKPKRFQKEGMFFNQKKLQSKYVADCLERFLLFASIMDLTTTENLQKWRQRLNIDNAFVHDMMNSNLYCDANNIINCFTTWLNQIDKSDFRIENFHIEDTVRELNKSKSLSISTSNDTRRNAILNSIVSALDRCIPIAYEELNKKGCYDKLLKQFYDTEERKAIFDEKIFSDIVSKSVVHSVSKWAFEAELAENVYAKKIRSSILDVWYSFYMNEGTTFEVKEYFVTDKAPFVTDYAYTYVWYKLLEQEFIYKIVLPGGEKAESSPYTGFVFEENDYILHNSQIKELSERPTDFQQFIYAYINMFPNCFANAFVEYIKSQTADAVKCMDNDKMDIFRTYPQMRRHVGVYI